MPRPSHFLENRAGEMRTSSRMRTRPDVVVLGGGGILGEAWMSGVLAGIEDAAGIEFASCESFIGTSAG